MIDALKDGVLNTVLHWRHGGSVENVRFGDMDAGTEVVVSVDRLPPLRDDAFRVVCISDTHDAHRAFLIPPADVLVHAGDLQMTSKRFSEKDNARKVGDVNQWLESLRHVSHKVVIGGNHDGYLESLGPAGAKAALSHAKYLIFEEAVLTHPRNPSLSLHVYGAPFSRGRSANDAYQLRREREAVCEKRGSRIPPSRIPLLLRAKAYEEKMGSSRMLPLYDLAITHEPYYAHLELGAKPREHRHQAGHVHIGGHLHAHYGIKRHRGVPCIVACSVSSRYAPANPPIVFDYVPRPCIARYCDETAPGSAIRSAPGAVAVAGHSDDAVGSVGHIPAVAETVAAPRCVAKYEGGLPTEFDHLPAVLNTQQGCPNAT